METYNTINSHRLDGQERKAVEFFNKEMKDVVVDDILCLSNFENYSHLTQEGKRRADILTGKGEIVDIVLDTFVQWLLATLVGYSYLLDLMKAVDEVKE